jgi:hypothetical protein
LLTISPSSLSFPSQLAGTQSMGQTITVGNTGTQNVPFTNISLTGSTAFSQTNTCGSQLAAAQSCSVTVKVLPTSSGAIAGVLSISDNASGSPQTISLNATGLDYQVNLSGTTATVQSGSSTTMPLSLVSLGGSLTDVITMSCSGLPRGAACTFSPSSVVASAGGTSVSLSISTTGATVAEKRSPFWETSSLAVLLLPVTFCLLRKSGRKGKGVWIVLLAIFGGLTVSCGGGGSNTPPPNPNQTPPGSYSLTVVATDGSQHRSAVVGLTVH